MTVTRLIKSGILAAKQSCAGAPYVIAKIDIDSPATRRAVTNRRPISQDPTSAPKHKFRGKFVISTSPSLRLLPSSTSPLIAGFSSLKAVSVFFRGTRALMSPP